MDEATIKANLEAIAKLQKAKDAQKAADTAAGPAGKDSKKDAKKGKKKWLLIKINLNLNMSNKHSIHSHIQ